MDTGAPRAARALLDLLRDSRGGGGDSPPSALPELIEAMDAKIGGESDWQRVKGWLQGDPTWRIEDDVPALQRAARRVRRFSFHTGRTDTGSRKPERKEPARASA